MANNNKKNPQKCALKDTACLALFEQEDHSKSLKSTFEKPKQGYPNQPGLAAKCIFLQVDTSKDHEVSDFKNITRAFYFSKQPAIVYSW